VAISSVPLLSRVKIWREILDTIRGVNTSTGVALIGKTFYGGDNFGHSVNVYQVPEQGALALFSMAVAAMSGRRRARGMAGRNEAI
jgi:hypothetical protein